jgi:hypothetical protein
MQRTRLLKKQGIKGGSTDKKDDKKDKQKKSRFEKIGLTESYEDYKQRLEKLQKGLGRESDDYNLRGAYEGGLQPELGEDGRYHLGSRNPKTGLILKRKEHPTFWKAVQGEAQAGYLMYKGADGNYYSVNANGMYIPPPSTEFGSVENGSVVMSDKWNNISKAKSLGPLGGLEIFNQDTKGFDKLMPLLLDAQIGVESKGNKTALSSAGAVGLGQIRPIAQKDLEQAGLIPTGLDPRDTADNLEMQYLYLFKRLPQFSAMKNAPNGKERMKRMLASYNAGPVAVANAVAKGEKTGVDWLTLLDKETQEYVPKVLNNAMDMLSSSNGNYQSPYDRSNFLP